jgi:hypothetical protein
VRGGSEDVPKFHTFQLSDGYSSVTCREDLSSPVQTTAQARETQNDLRLIQADGDAASTSRRADKMFETPTWHVGIGHDGCPGEATRHYAWHSLTVVLQKSTRCQRKLKRWTSAEGVSSMNSEFQTNLTID